MSKAVTLKPKSCKNRAVAQTATDDQSLSIIAVQIGLFGKTAQKLVRTKEYVRDCLRLLYTKYQTGRARRLFRETFRLIVLCVRVRQIIPLLHKRNNPNSAN